MSKANFRFFLKDIALGFGLLTSILILCNISGIFELEEQSSQAELMWRDLIKKDSVNKTQIIFSGNSITEPLNPLILDSITNSTSCFFGFRGASIY